MRYLAATLIVMTTSLVLVACQGGDNDRNARKGAESFLPPQKTTINSYPPLTKGSAYEDLINTVIFEWGTDKGEFETTIQYRERIAKIERDVESRFGSKFAFKDTSAGLTWDADRELLTILYHGETYGRPSITLGMTDTNENITKIYKAKTQSCQLDPKIKITPDEARIYTSGIRDKSIGVFFVGSIDFTSNGRHSKPETILESEPVPGFYVFNAAMPERLNIVLSFDYNVERIDVVEISSGRILNSVNCGR